MSKRRRGGRRKPQPQPAAAVEAAAVEDVLAGDKGTAKLRSAIPWPLKLFGALVLASGFATFAVCALLLAGSILGVLSSEIKLVTVVLNFVETGVTAVASALYIALGWKLLHDQRRHSALIARATMTSLVVSLLISLMVVGPTAGCIGLVAQILVLVVLQSYLDPSLAQERELRRRLRKLEERSEEEKRLERERRFRGKAPYELNYFNIFWTFVVCSVIGLAVEMLSHFVTHHGFQDRTGMLFGPFSPIYGFGAVLMTLALNRIRDKNPVLIFVLSAVIGGAFEYFTSWFMQFAFGITAWDYTGTFLSIDGRTNFFYMVCWGVLGVVWVKLLLPLVFKLVYVIPWDWRYAVTGVATALMLANGAMTLQALNCWYERQSGVEPSTPVQLFYAEHFGDEWMEGHFQTMTIDANRSARVDKGLLPQPGMTDGA